MIGVGRYHEGIQFSVSSRYQYATLIFFTPFLGIFVSTLLKHLFKTPLIYSTVSSVLIFAWVLQISIPWGAELQTWSVSRGKEGRAFFLKKKQAGPVWYGLPPVISLEDGNRVVNYYNLH